MTRLEAMLAVYRSTIPPESHLTPEQARILAILEQAAPRFVPRARFAAPGLGTTVSGLRGKGYAINAKQRFGYQLVTAPSSAARSEG